MNPDNEAIVYVVDDEEAARSAITSLLASVGLKAKTFASPADFTAAKRARGPACLVLDVRLPGVSGLDFQRELQASNDNLPVIFITGHGDIPMSVEAMKAGAVEFLTKPFRGQALLDAIQRALEKAREANAEIERLALLRERYAKLTPREQEVMQLVITGLLNKQIAAQLGTSERTIKIHRGQVVRKMQATSLPDLVRMGDKLGLPSPKY
ncbi:MAG: response regulator transcription factor [Bryobacteraceae bacterium]